MAPAVVVYLAGVPWDGAEGTDRRLVSALSAYERVLWVDPPMSAVHRAGAGVVRTRSSLRQVAAQVERLSVVGPPFVTRPGVRIAANAVLARKLSGAVTRLGGARGVVLANPLMGFPREVAGPRLYYVTDDWPAGASLMGLSRRAIERFQAANLRHADVIAAVSPVLADRLSTPCGRAVSVVPNGCDVIDPANVTPVDLQLAPPVVGLTGQLNERLDLELLGAIADRGLSLALVGGRRERTSGFAEELDRLVARPNVRWYGHQPAACLPGYLAAFSVGITPYVTSDFNAASFPIKTLDYLAAGLPTVATPLPALGWLSTDLVEVAETPQGFAEAVVGVVSRPVDRALIARRVAFARRHSWAARATQLLGLLSLPAGSRSRPDQPADPVSQTRGTS